MAIKFSQFVERTNSSDLSHIVGYNGVDNIQITPTNFLNSALTGTAGQVLFYDTTGVTGDNDLYWDNANKRLGIGTSVPAEKLHVEGNIQLGTFNKISGGSSDNLVIAADFNNTSGGSSIDFQLDGATSAMFINNSRNVGIGTTSPSQKLEVNGNIKVGDSQQFIAGAGNDLQIYHDGTTSNIANYTNNLSIINHFNDGDIKFFSDDGSGGVTEYFRIDGGYSVPYTIFPDNSTLALGSDLDLRIIHNGTDTFIDQTGNGDLYIRNKADDKDIIFQSDDGSGGVETYFRLDGSANSDGNPRTIFPDNAILALGTSQDFTMKHDATNTELVNVTGNLNIKNSTTDGDIRFFSDDGSGGVTEYFRIDGTTVQNTFSKTTNVIDNFYLGAGNSTDLYLTHNGTNSSIINNTGNLTIQNNHNDGDILFRSDDGSGGTATYMSIDGAEEQVRFFKPTEHGDSVLARFGNSGDLKIYHDGSNSTIDNSSGHLFIRNSKVDRDILFQGDDGTGTATTTYFMLDGGQSQTRVFKNFKFEDNVKGTFGTSDDLQIFHDGTSSYIRNAVGNLNIQQNTDDADISFQCDDGSGSLAEYFRLDGSSVQTIAEKDFRFVDNAKVILGTGSDLQIYHDNFNTSYIKHGTTGDFRIVSDSTGYIKIMYALENMGVFIPNGAVELYHNNVKKFDTRTTGVRIIGVSEYADNTAAIAGGLTTGDVYRTGDLLKIVH